MHTCDGLVVTCIDFRLQEFIDNFIKNKFGTKNHDRVAIAGGVKDFDNVLNQIKISKRLHDIKTVVLVNHEDCGAYAEAGTKEKHEQDLRAASEKIKSEIPGIDVENYFLKLDGTFKPIL